MRQCAGRHQPCALAERVRRRGGRAVADAHAALGPASDRRRRSPVILRRRSGTALRGGAAGLRLGIRSSRSLVAGGHGAARSRMDRAGGRERISPRSAPSLLQPSCRPTTAASRRRSSRRCDSRFGAANGISPLRAQYEDPLWLLLAIAALVLLTACANLASLSLVRATARSPSWRCASRSAPPDTASSAS